MIKKIKRILKSNKFFIDYLFNISLFKKQNQKEIIIVFDGKIKHGGFVDRMKGIISFYQIAQEVGAVFKIYYTQPYNLEGFLNPNKVNWIADKNDLIWNPFYTKVFHFMDDSFSNPLSYLNKSNKQKYIVYSNSEFQHKTYKTEDKDWLNKKWQESYHELFRKSDYLSMNLEKLTLDKNRIAIHTRFTSIFGDFKDINSKPVSAERKAEIIEELKSKIDTIIDDNPNKSVYVFSDSISFLNEIKGYKNCKITEGKPNHIDFKGNNNLEEHLKTVLDFYAIAESQKVYLLQSEDMYNSSFSRYAAVVGGKEFRIIKV